MSQYISLAHGDGGEWSHKLIQDVFVESFGHKKAAMFDAASLEIPANKIAVSTDSFVIKPLFFPGGSIGKLAVAGTVNDLAVSHAKPLYLTCGFVIEEGFPIADLKRIVNDMAKEAEKAGVSIVAGDTKVVERGSADGLFINTTGIGIKYGDVPTHEQFQEGDAVIVTGTLGDHGISVLAAREDVGFTVQVESDCASLNGMLEQVWSDSNGVKIMRDPTRGGLATTLVEITEDFQLTIELDELQIPVKDEVHGVCDMIGFDPLYLANEGKAVMIVDKNEAENILAKLKECPEGKDAKVIGQVTSKQKGCLLLQTPLGSKRLLSRLTGTMLPRIC